jgi:LDH2 family malate/lactate/ureidoglycolate dehydrogenase
MPRQDFEQRMDTFVDTVKELPRAADVDEILIPGEPEERVTKQRGMTGIPIKDDIVRLLREEADRFAIVLPDSSPNPLKPAS